MEVHKVPYPKGTIASSHFRKLTQEVIHDCWAMNAPTIPMQAWCRDRHLPAMVLGSGDEEIGLPSASTDFQALGRHAAGEILRQGHRRIAVILPRQEKGEDIQTRQGVASAIDEAPHSGLHLSLEYHDHTEVGICRLADRLLKQTARPTAWLVCRQGHFLTLFTYLLHRGVRIPNELSIISRDSDIYFDNLIPTPSRYVIDSELMVRQYARLIMRVAARQCPPGHRARLMPQFIPGQTLGPR